jgi:hypothetical protein
MAMVVLAQFRNTHWIAVLLSSDGNPLAEHRAATNSDEPSETAESLTHA